ncbi:hypothetical protein M422DRAFT_24410 [Sphaerobolus stellatus SS14]|nr:hypothetical protein M422DRAFT_24410 [Sphaerobolus stellatus SS14]
MSAIYLQGNAPTHSGSESDSASSDSEDGNFEGWDTDSGTKPCKSLFDTESFPSVEAALEHDKTKHGFDIYVICRELSLDFHKRARLINYIRKEKPSSERLGKLTGTESIFTDDAFLLPVIEDDPLLQFHTDEWTDEDEDDEEDAEKVKKDLPEVIARHVRRLEEKLAAAQASLVHYKQWVEERFTERLNQLNIPDKEERPARDDDTHYFSSYAENDIHAIMIQDTVRTSSYASFILTNPALFRGATVMDVGCGTGILSLFAAQAGAKRVIAVDASAIAERAEKNVKDNGMDHIITVVRGKVEEIQLPDGIEKVDIIVSEWMGYALLYESMLDSVLVARDRFLKPGGVMVPSQCKMMFGLCEAKEIYKDRVEFWNDIYGYDLSAMTADVYDEAIIDVVPEESLVSNAAIVKDLPIGSLSIRSLNFSSSFKLTATRRVLKAHAFILYFDTFFTPTGESVAEDAKVHLVKEGEASLAEVWQVPGKIKRKDSLGGKGKEVSFSTGPESRPTHWKQALFLLKEPLKVEEGTVITGTFYCRKSEENSRELDVEIHYKEEGDSTATVVQMYHVR